MKKYSKKWMQTFVDGKFPENDKIIEEISKKAFEVEDLEVVGEGENQDSLFEIKVLPNRVSDAFCIEGMAREFATVFDLKVKEYSVPKFDLSKIEEKKDFLKIEIAKDGTNPVNSFFAAKILVDQKTETPDWVKDIIEKSGGRIINPIVDFTNLIIFSFGQPCHAFDAKKIKGKLQIRFAKSEEKLTILGGKEIILRETDLVVADDNNALDLAGVKGGILAEVDANTEEIIFIVPNFNDKLVRAASMHHSIRTDASKLFENNVSSFKTEEVFQKALSTIMEIFPNAKTEYYFKVFENIKHNPKISFSVSDVARIAGIEISKEEIKKIIIRLSFQILEEAEENFVVQAHNYRLDINIKEDLLEEIMRIYGFDNIPSIPLKIENNYFAHNPKFLLENYLKNFFYKEGFTELYNYTFVDKGDLKVLLPLAEDKSYLRNNLLDGAQKAFQKNYTFTPVMETEIIKFFEIGSIFTESIEERRIVICLDDGKKKTKYSEQLEALLTKIETDLGISKISTINKTEKPAIIEFSLDKIIAELTEKNIIGNLKFVEIDKKLDGIKYKPISVYPFIVRDVAVWVPTPSFEFESLKADILKLDLLNVEKVYLFDSFTKKDESGNEKTSIAFRIIFQSYEKTLTDEEIEKEMQKVSNYLKENNFEIR